MSRGDKKPLWRKVNTRTWGVRHGGPSDDGSRDKARLENGAMSLPMRQGRRNGRDYTPLFRFLLSRVGQDWDAVHAEAVARLDTPEPIGWMVAASPEEGEPILRMGESSYYSGLCVDAHDKLAKIAPDLTVEQLWPACACCTHTFNGVRYTNAYDPARR